MSHSSLWLLAQFVALSTTPIRWQGLNWQLVKNKYGGFYKWGYPKWMVYKGKSIYKWMIWGYPYDLGTPHMCSWTIWSAGTWLFLAVRWHWHLRRRLPPSWKKVEQPAGSGSKRSKRAARLSSDLTTSSIIDHLLVKISFHKSEKTRPTDCPMACTVNHLQDLGSLENVRCWFHPELGIPQDH